MKISVENVEKRNRISRDDWKPVSLGVSCASKNSILDHKIKTFK